MAVADMVAEWFESEPLKATLAASGILGSFLGPASAGSTAVMMLLGAAGGEAVATGWSAVGGPQSVSDALAWDNSFINPDIDRSALASGKVQIPAERAEIAV